ncbi:fluoride efflux transporter CrcB [Rhodococcus sp. P1Y]|uniref:fluoride efflux transporter CrcB n=1 Tax=Rhodococcus sp. P1Y TaxID=1302308 RepID=UPI000EB5B1AD|nr:fluoride efflux transporter CrcB [Rhodococcus sp. P1Y]AYJ50175.1 fluoride efflux transporter CrcB [Rhodococcus sp. P1Y]
MIAVLLVLAGALGAVSRFVLDSYVKSKTSTSRFPWATVGINVTGSLLLGVLAGFVLFRDGSTDLQAIVGTGFCGGYTTFSTASFETVRLVQSGKRFLALINALGTLVLSVAACAVGVAVAGLTM